MEFGARALGNRSILARSDNNKIKEKVNKMIKNRDFWMPFAPIIIDDYASKYIENPKKILSPYNDTSLLIYYCTYYTSDFTCHYPKGI